MARPRRSIPPFPWLAALLATALLAVPPAAATEPKDMPMNATLWDSSGKEVGMARWRGKPVILFYEDRHSTTLNADFKQALFTQGQALGLLDAAWVVAVANLESFNFFPAREIALSHVREEEKKWGVPILVDLRGSLGRAPWGLPKKTSTVVLLDAEGTIVFRHSGRLEQAETGAFFQALVRLLGQRGELEAHP